MANDIYSQTHTGLTTMISSRAATRVLNNILKTYERTPDSIDASLMNQLLLGPILQELEGILPRDGLQRQLSEIAESLKSSSPKAQTSKRRESPPSFVLEDADDVQTFRLEELEDDVPQIEELLAPVVAELENEAVVPALVESSETMPDESLADMLITESLPHVADTGVPNTGVSDNVVPDIAAFEPPPAAASATSQAATAVMNKPQESVSEPPSESPVLESPAAVHAVSDAPVLSDAPPLSKEKLEHIAVSFAQIEQVQLVAALRQNGDIALSRGSGLDLPSLSRVGLMALRLLSKSGKLKSYNLTHSEGQLFLFPFGSDTIVIQGKTDLNVGAVFSAFSTLKEEV